MFVSSTGSSYSRLGLFAGKTDTRLKLGKVQTRWIESTPVARKVCDWDPCHAGGVNAESITHFFRDFRFDRNSINVEACGQSGSGSSLPPQSSSVQ